MQQQRAPCFTRPQHCQLRTFAALRAVAAPPKRAAPRAPARAPAPRPTAPLLLRPLLLLLPLLAPPGAPAREVTLDVPDALADLLSSSSSPSAAALHLLLRSPWLALGASLLALALLPRVLRAAARWLLWPALAAALAFAALTSPDAAAGALHAALLFARAHPALVR